MKRKKIFNEKEVVALLMNEINEEYRKTCKTNNNKLASINKAYIRELNYIIEYEHIELYYLIMKINKFMKANNLNFYFIDNSDNSIISRLIMGKDISHFEYLQLDEWCNIDNSKYPRYIIKLDPNSAKKCRDYLLSIKEIKQLLYTENYPECYLIMPRWIKENYVNPISEDIMNELIINFPKIEIVADDRLKCFEKINIMNTKIKFTENLRHNMNDYLVRELNYGKANEFIGKIDLNNFVSSNDYKKLIAYCFMYRHKINTNRMKLNEIENIEKCEIISSRKELMNLLLQSGIEYEKAFKLINRIAYGFLNEKNIYLFSSIMNKLEKDTLLKILHYIKFVDYIPNQNYLNYEYSLMLNIANSREEI